MATTGWFVALALLLLAVDEARSACGLSNMATAAQAAAAEATPYAITTFTSAGSYAASDTCDMNFKAPTTYMYIVQPTSVDVSCSSTGAASGSGGETLAYHDTVAGTGTAIILAADGCSDTLAGTAQTAYPVVATTSVHLRVELVADAGGTLGAGYTLKYMAAKATAGSCVVAGGTPDALTATSTVQYLTSAGFPVGLGGSEDCEYKITATAPLVVQMKIQMIDLPTASPCSADYVKLFTGSDTTATPIGFYCGTSWTETSATSGTNVMTVQLKNTVANTVHGFIGTYQAVAGATAMKSWGLLTIIAVSLGYLLSRYTD